MGRLFLSGGGNEKQTQVLDEIFIKDINKILYIPIAWNDTVYDDCVKWFKKMLALHKKETKVDVLTELNKNINLNDYDAVYIGGGNTFKLLNAIKINNFDKKLVDYYNSHGTIYGGSAGAIIFGYDIYLALLCKDKDVNKIGLKNLSGINLVNGYDIQCHFEENQVQEHQKYIKKSGRNIVAIPEESALMIDNGKLTVIGTKPITVISKNKSKNYSPNQKVII
ncbi:type 1 glutamine amidotransferase-like domain-containing protein [Candidatus Pacearchaeota archaeon]|nr:type 1 glutamine amidotransferase-like domain-containing protein [Candidatus Pacearchaeota archaeon]